MLDKNNLLPSYIIQASSQVAMHYVEQFLRRIYCQSTDIENCWCSVCKKISTRQHFNSYWINPERDYTTEDIEVIFQKIYLQLEENEHFFFILCNAQRLTSTVANRLLKCIEEPTRGYHFILLTHNASVIIQTIVSRCITIYLQHEAEHYNHPLIKYFTEPDLLSDPIAFSQSLQKHRPTNRQAQEIVDELVRTTCSDIKNTDPADAAHASSILEYLYEKMRKPAQSGSGLFFLRLLYLKYPRKQLT